MTTRLIVVALAAGACLAQQDAAAQRTSVDLRVVGAAPAQRFAGADLSLGLGLGATLAYRVAPSFAAYAGWDWVHFQADQSFAGTDMDFEETGYTLGARFEHPTSEASRVKFRIEAGATYKHVEIENQAGDIIEDSGHEFGFEAGGGLIVPLASQWWLTPTVRFRTLTPDFTVSGATTNAKLRYAGLELGVSRAF